MLAKLRINHLATVFLIALPCSAPAQLSPVSLDGHYFKRDGRRFIPAGVHWVPAKAAMQWPMEWDPAAIEADFRKMRELGVNTVRLDLVWAWFEPRPGEYNPEAFRQFDYFVTLAHRYRIYLEPSLFIGNEVGEAVWDVPWRNGRHPHADPEMLRLETNHAAEFGRHYARETAIHSWDLTDEPPFWNTEGKTSDAMAINWTRLISGAIRRYDKLHPIVVGTDAADLSHGPFRPDLLLDEVDFLSVHPYPIYSAARFPDPMLSERTTYAASFQTALSGGAGKPVMVQEIGASSAQYSPERIAQYLRANLYSALGAGANGFLLWCFTDAAPETYQRVPYRRAAHETQFGLTTWDGKDRPSGTEFRRFSKMLERLDLTDVAPARPDAGLPVPFDWSKPYSEMKGLGLPLIGGVPYVSNQEPGSIAGQEQPANAAPALTSSWLTAFILAHRAGLTAGFPREYSDWRSLPMMLVPAPLTHSTDNVTHVHTVFWERAKEYVRAGGVLYASMSGETSVPDAEELLGARLADRFPTSEVRIRVVEPFGGLKPGDEFVYHAGGGPESWGVLLEPKGGKVIATDQEGRPALVANALGKGKVLVSAYPIESYVAALPAAFETTEPTHRIYRALAEWAGVASRFRTDSEKVESATLAGRGRGYVVLTNHGAAARDVRVTGSAALAGASRVGADGLFPLRVERNSFTVRLEAYDGAVIEYREP